MSKTREVLLVIDAARAHDRNLVRGVASYALEKGDWALYIEEDPLRKLPKLSSNWDGHGIIANFDDPQVAKAVRGVKVPLVRFGGGSGWGDPTLADAYLDVNNESIVSLAIEHLLDRGYQRLAYCDLPREQRQNPWPRLRTRAFRQKAREIGFSCQVFTHRGAGARDWVKLRHHLASWLNSLEKPVGILCCHDICARHVVEACRLIGTHVPEQVAVLGVSNEEIVCEQTRPPISSVDHGAKRMGRLAAEVLDRLMSGKGCRCPMIVVEPEGVVLRRSTDTLAIEDPTVADAVRFIWEHACDGIQARQVVKVTAVSRSTLDARFQAVLGRTIHEEIQLARLNRAKQLVAATDMPLKQIAASVGFTSVQYMTTWFREHIGSTPADYRRQKRV